MGTNQEDEQRRGLERLVHIIQKSADPASALHVALSAAETSAIVRKQAELDKAVGHFSRALDAVREAAAIDPTCRAYCSVAAQTEGQAISGESLGNLIRTMAQGRAELASVVGDRWRNGQGPAFVFGRMPFSDQEVGRAYARFTEIRADAQQNGPLGEIGAFKLAIASLLEEPTAQASQSAS